MFVFIAILEIYKLSLKVIHAPRFCGALSTNERSELGRFKHKLIFNLVVMVRYINLYIFEKNIKFINIYKFIYYILIFLWGRVRGGAHI